MIHTHRATQAGRDDAPQAKEELKSKLKDMKAVQFAEKKLLQWSGGLLSDPFHLRGMPLEDKPPLMDIFPDLFSKA